MKKIFTILLIAIVAAAACFADAAKEASTIRLRSGVSSINIAVANAATSGGLYQLTVDNGLDDEEGVSAFTSASDISREDVVASFKITQKAATRTVENIDLTVTANALSFVDRENQKHESELPEITSWGNPGLGPEFFTVQLDTEVAENVLKINLQYRSVTKEVPGGTAIGTFKATWAKKPELADYPGTYVSDIALTYTIV